METPHTTKFGLLVRRITMRTGTKKIRNSVSEFGRFMAHDGGGADPWLRPPQFHYRLGVRMRQHVRGGSGSAPRSPNPLGFFFFVVTPWLTRSQKHQSRKLYFFLIRLPQNCANEKSA